MTLHTLSDLPLDKPAMSLALIAIIVPLPPSNLQQTPEIQELLPTCMHKFKSILPPRDVSQLRPVSSR